MDVHETIREGLDQHRRDNSHPASHHHRIHLFGLEGPDQLGIQLLLRVNTRWSSRAWGTSRRSASDGTTVRDCCDQRSRLGVQPSRVRWPERHLQYRFLTPSPKPEGRPELGLALFCSGGCSNAWSTA